MRAQWIGYNDNLFSQVLLTVDEFLDQLRKSNPKDAENYIVTPDNTVAEVRLSSLLMIIRSNPFVAGRTKVC